MAEPQCLGMHRRSGRRALLSVTACASFFLLVLNVRIDTDTVSWAQVEESVANSLYC